MSEPPLEIERVFLLSRLPELPPGAAAVEVEQGYLPEGEAGPGPFAEGRVRRTRSADGRVRCTHTIKRGEGLVREEVEREISEPEFLQAWARTAGRRISKVRHKVKEGGLTWEVDAFRGCELVLAEVELPSAETEAPLPAWLAPCVLREVTWEPAFRNYNLACLLGSGRPLPHQEASP